VGSRNLGRWMNFEGGGLPGITRAADANDIMAMVEIALRDAENTRN
jgi:hypothetical protein